MKLHAGPTVKLVDLWAPFAPEVFMPEGEHVAEFTGSKADAEYPSFANHLGASAGIHAKYLLTPANAGQDFWVEVIRLGITDKITAARVDTHHAEFDLVILEHRWLTWLSIPASQPYYRVQPRIYPAPYYLENPQKDWPDYLRELIWDIVYIRP